MNSHYQSFAKLNLFLYVESRRSDGYHNLYSLMTRIDLHDDIFLDFSTQNIQVSCDYPGVPEDDTNLAARAATSFFDAARKVHGLKKTGLGIRIVKRIPPGGGLGGGSSNAATILMGLNEYYGSPFSKHALMKLGVSLGADVPFFIYKKPALARGVGEKLESIGELVPCHVVLCDPGIHASTAQVYKNIDFRLTKKRYYTINTGLNVPLRGQGFDVRGRLHNDLEEAACRLYPGIAETKEEMAFLLDQDVYMTGSGASLFTLYPDKESAMAGYEKLSTCWEGSKKKVILSLFR